MPSDHLTDADLDAMEERAKKAFAKWDCIKYAERMETVRHEEQQWAAKHAAKLLADIPALVSDLREARGLLGELIDDDECELDRHGYCQTHGWMETEPPCPVARTRAFLGEEGEGGQ